MTVEIEGRAHSGSLRVAAGDSGLVLIEETSLDSYLLGIAEVPFSWPEEALRAQAIAARTYLAWTLDRGRSSNGRRYGYDICATDHCQVYRGLSGVRSADGDRWRSAVTSTADQILMVDGDPLQALYSSTSGGRTRSVEDVFGGDPNPHLRAVGSPGEASPFVAWRFPIEFEEMEAMAAAAGHLRGQLLTVRTVTTDDGDGPWLVQFVGSEGTVDVPTWELRTDLNRAAATFPDRFPVTRPDRPDRRYPQTIMSPTFTIREAVRYETRPNGLPEFVPFFEVRGNGWGHLVGMSQYGAEAMASRGSSAEEILSHFYGGLLPTPAPEALPETVRIGLTTSAGEITVSPDGPVSVIVDGTVVVDAALGSWSFSPDGPAVLVEPPIGLGLPPEIEDLRVLDGNGTVDAISGRLVSAAEVRVTVEVGDRTLYRSEWAVAEAGAFIHSVRTPLRPTSPLRMKIESRSPSGTDTETITVVAAAA